MAWASGPPATHCTNHTQSRQVSNGPHSALCNLLPPMPCYTGCWHATQTPQNGNLSGGGGGNPWTWTSEQRGEQHLGQGSRGYTLILQWPCAACEPPVRQCCFIWTKFISRSCKFYPDKKQHIVSLRPLSLLCHKGTTFCHTRVCNQLLLPSKLGNLIHPCFSSKHFHFDMQNYFWLGWLRKII